LSLSLVNASLFCFHRQVDGITFSVTIIDCRRDSLVTFLQPWLADWTVKGQKQGRTDHLETRALPEGPGSVGGPMRCPWYLFHRLF
ncbi:unnamed protein product, partial [Staurois parvus]